MRAPCFVPSRDLRRVLGVTILSNMGIGVVVPSGPSRPFICQTARCFTGSVIRCNTRICVCRGNFLRSGIVIISSRVMSMNATGVSIHDFGLGFRVGTFVCSHSMTRRLVTGFSRSRGGYVHTARSCFTGRSGKQGFGRTFSELLSPVL